MMINDLATIGAKKMATPVLFLFAATLPFQGAAPTYPISSDVQTTRQQTVRPVLLPDEQPYLTITEAGQYGPRGYSSWRLGDGVDAGARLLDDTAIGSYHPTETLLSFFSMSDIHIVDKESPVRAVYGVLGPTQIPPLGFGNVNTSAYSPIMLSTTQVLDAAVKTINALHGRTPFDFGISLGNDANSTQYNELRWFIDVMDGKWIHPSTGAHRGATSIDYQRPYQAAGLDKSIPWYQVIGNHDQFWCGSLFYNDYARSVVVGNKVMDMGYDDSVTPPFPSLVETLSLRDHPQQFRTFQIVRNDNNTISIFITDVDPTVQGTGSPAEKSRGYALGAGEDIHRHDHDSLRPRRCHLACLQRGADQIAARSVYPHA